MAKDTFWFPHDYNARNDVKIKNLIRKLGFEGYGIFWSIVEELYNNNNAMPNYYDAIAYDLRTDVEKVRSIIEDFDLFVVHNGYFGSTSIERRINERLAKSKKAQISANRRWEQCERNANASKSHCESDANASKSHCESDANAMLERKKERKKDTQTPTVSPSVTPQAVVVTSTNFSDRSIAMVEFVKTLKNVSKLKDQLTHEEADRLLDKFPKETLKEILLEMENYKLLTKKSNSVNLTIRSWLKRRSETLKRPHDINQNFNGITAN